MEDLPFLHLDLKRMLPGEKFSKNEEIIIKTDINF